MTNHRGNFYKISGFFQAIKYSNYVSTSTYSAQPPQIWIVGPCPLTIPAQPKTVDLIPSIHRPRLAVWLKC